VLTRKRFFSRLKLGGVIVPLPWCHWAMLMGAWVTVPVCLLTIFVHMLMHPSILFLWYLC